MRTSVSVLSACFVLALACGSGSPDRAAGAPPVPVGAPPAPATAPTVALPEPVTGWMIIASGAPDPVAAEEQLASYRAQGLPAMGGFPRVVDSSTVEGLKPGFHVVVVGIVDDEAVAKAISEAWQPVRPGTYVREVRVPAPEHVTCEGPAADPRCRPGPAPGWRALVIMDFTDGMQSEDWAAFTDQVCKTVQEHAVVCERAADTRVPIVVGGAEKGVVDVEPFMGELYGYVFAMEGKPPVYHAHDMPHVVLYDGGVYWGLPLGK